MKTTTSHNCVRKNSGKQHRHGGNKVKPEERLLKVWPRRILFTLSPILTLLMACSDRSSEEKNTTNIGPTSFFGNMRESNAASVQRITPLELPNDHKSHPDFQLEWWYLTFVLEDQQQNEYGMQFTLFRFRGNEGPNSSRLASSWSDNQQWMGHASLHSSDFHFFEERFAAGGVGNAYVNAAPFEAVIDDWSWKAKNTNSDLFPSSLIVTLSSTTYDTAHAALQLTAKGPYIKQGDEGYSIKTSDERLRSYYYSQPFIEARGNLVFDDKKVAVNGLGWFDHEWTSHLANNQAMGWDWFSIHFDNGDKLMAFRMHATNNDIGKKGDKERTENGMFDVFTTASIINKNGEKETFYGNNISIQPETTSLITSNNKVHHIPTSWRISIPSKKMDVTTSPFKQNQWNPSLFPYYEGRISASGTHKGTGFMELTGY